MPLCAWSRAYVKTVDWPHVAGCLATALLKNVRRTLGAPSPDAPSVRARLYSSRIRRTDGGQRRRHSDNAIAVRRARRRRIRDRNVAQSSGPAPRFSRRGAGLSGGGRFVEAANRQIDSRRGREGGHVSKGPLKRRWACRVRRRRRREDSSEPSIETESARERPA